MAYSAEKTFLASCLVEWKTPTVVPRARFEPEYDIGQSCYQKWHCNNIYKFAIDKRIWNRQKDYNKNFYIYCRVNFLALFKNHILTGWTGSLVEDYSIVFKCLASDPRWAILLVSVSSYSSPHYLWRSFGLFSLMRAQKWRETWTPLLNGQLIPAVVAYWHLFIQLF